jgi:hypothetical protein
VHTHSCQPASPSAKLVCARVACMLLLRHSVTPRVAARRLDAPVWRWGGPAVSKAVAIEALCPLFTSDYQRLGHPRHLNHTVVCGRGGGVRRSGGVPGHAQGRRHLARVIPPTDPGRCAPQYFEIS